METNADHIRLEIDGLGLHFDRDYGIQRRTGWSLSRDGSFILQFVTWEEAWAALTVAERVRCIVLANSLR